MLLWSMILLIILLVVGILFAYLWRKNPADEISHADAAILLYEQQLTLLEEAKKAGNITKSECVAQEKEIAKRLLQAQKRLDEFNESAKENAKENGRTNITLTPKHKIIALLLWVMVPSLGLGLYGWQGMPSAGDWPLAGNKAKRLAQMAENPELALQAIITQAKRQLALDPNHMESHLLLMRNLVRLNRLEEALEAAQKAAIIAPDNAEIISEQGEILTAMQNGYVGDEARELFFRVTRLNPTDPKAYFYIAEGEWQRNNPDTAIGIWQDLIENAPPNAPWLAIVQQRLAKAQGIQAATNNNAFNEDERDMIMAMVDGLREKLTDNPDNEEGWQRLIRAYEVLDQPDDLAFAMNGLIVYYESQAALNPKQSEALILLRQRIKP